jgi:hypothetical protein
MKRRIISAAIPAAAGLLAIGAAALPAAQAAQQTAANAQAPTLHATATIALGSTSNIFKNIFAEAPDRAVFFSKGSVVYVQKNGSAPQIALHAGRQVIALAANSADLFVQTGLTVTEYRRSSGAKVRHWLLSSPRTPITIARLIVVGQTLWSQTDAGTDSTGALPAVVSRIVTTSSAVHLVSRKANYGPLAADSGGLYFDNMPTPTTENLVHVSPAGAIHHRAGRVNGLMAIGGGRLDVLFFHSGHLFLDSYGLTSLARLSSARVSNHDRDLAGTGLGLLVLQAACSQLTCAAATVSKLAISGAVSGTLAVPSATDAKQTITTPRPVKNPICSIALAIWPPTGTPCAGRLLVQIGASALPTANHAPLAAASDAPSSAIGRSLLISRKSPPSSVPAAGRISSHRRPDVIFHA